MDRPRVGLGWDQHAFDPHRVLRLGGVEIPDHPGLAGHSDGDVVLHAVADALLGAVGQADIGTAFPPGDPRWAGVESSYFVQHARRVLAQRGYTIGNLDVVIVAQKPRLVPYLENMRNRLAELCGLEPEAVNLKAKAPEGLGDLGQGRGICAIAVALVWPVTAAPGSQS